MSDNRAVNTVADVSLALVILTAAIGLLLAAPDKRTPGHDEAQADRTAEVVTTATVHVPYSLEPIVEDAEGGGEYDPEKLRRVSHGSVAGLLADAAVADLTRDGDAGEQTLTPAGAAYERAIESRFQARLVGSNFETNVTALWEPYEGGELRGTATVGQPVPPAAEYSSVQLSVPSGFEAVEAAGAPENDDDFEAVARRVAAVLVEGYAPPLEAKHSLERSGLERTLAVYRYERLAALIEGVDPDDYEITANLPAESAAPERINEHLTASLTAQIAADMEERFDSADAAAAAVSTSELTVIVRTWEP